MTKDPGGAAPDPAPDTLEVTVLRSGGVAGMVRRWSAGIPDDGTPAARAARRIAGPRGGAEPPGNSRCGNRRCGNWRSEEHRNVHQNPVSGGTVDHQMESGLEGGPMRRDRARDAFQWTITCGEGSLRCDDAGRREDPEVDELIRRVTAPGATDAGITSG